MNLNSTGGALAEPLINTQPVEKLKKEVSPFPCAKEKRINATSNHILGRVLDTLEIPLAGRLARKVIKRKIRVFEEGLEERNLTEKHIPILVNELWRLFSDVEDLREIDSQKIILDRHQINKESPGIFSIRDFKNMEDFLRYAIARLNDSCAITNKAAKKVKKHLENRLELERLGANDVGMIGLELWRKRSEI